MLKKLNAILLCATLVAFATLAASCGDDTGSAPPSDARIADTLRADGLVGDSFPTCVVSAQGKCDKGTPTPDTTSGKCPKGGTWVCTGSEIRQCSPDGTENKDGSGCRFPCTNGGGAVAPCASAQSTSCQTADKYVTCTKQ